MKSSPIVATSPRLRDASRLTLEQLEEAWRCAREETASAYEIWCTVPSAQRRIAYMAAIAPFRHLIVYPLMLRDIERQWRVSAGDPAAALA